MSPAPGIFAQHVVWPVGHGGFTTGQIFAPDGTTPPFTYVYDCGARNLSLLGRRIGAFAAMTRRVDLLFLSHLDADHVNGVALLSPQLGPSSNPRLTIDTVVLPYLDRTARLMVAGAALTPGNNNRALFDLLADPQHWAGQRGIGSIVFVQRADGEGGPSPETILNEYGPEARGDRERSWWSSREMEDVGSPDHAVEARLLHCRSGLCHGPSPETTWVFVPHVPPVDPEREREFLRQVTQDVPELPIRTNPATAGPGLPFPELAEVLRDPQKRGRLKRAYGAIAGQHNGVSLSLFSGPLSTHQALIARYGPRDSMIFGGRHWPHCILGPGNRYGYLFTGDAPLGRHDYEDAFFHTYGKWIDHVHHAHVPHHGSWRSVSVDFFRRLHGARFVVSAGRHSRTHPSHKVVNWAIGAGDFCQVDERDASRIVEDYVQLLP